MRRSAFLPGSTFLYNPLASLWSLLMIFPSRIRRQARDRAISIVLAVVIGLVFGVGGWLLWRHQVLLPTPNEPIKSEQADVPLVPHKALYAVSMVSARNGSQIIDINGKMFYQMHQGCDAYITDHRFVLTYDYADSEPMRVTSDFSTVENSDGTKFDFSSRRRRDGEMYQELRGKAEIEDKKDGIATYAQPGDLSFDLTSETLFPAAHTRALIAAARSGQKFVATRIFDGSDEEGPVDVTAVIGEKTNGPVGLTPSATLARAPLETSAWKIRLAFFPVKGGAETADYELTMVLHENGVISDMTIDYQDFSVQQRLLALEPLAPENCTAAGKSELLPSLENPSAPLKADPVPARPFR